MDNAGLVRPGPQLRLSRGQRALAALVVVLIICLILENSVVTARHRSYSETFTRTESSTADTFYAMNEALSYVNETQRYLLGSVSRRDVQLKRALLAQRLGVVDQNGRTAGDSASAEFHAALNSLDDMIRQVPPGVLPVDQRPHWAALVVPRTEELGRASRRYADNAGSALHADEGARSGELLQSRLLELLLLVATLAAAAVLLAWVAVNVRRQYQSAHTALEAERMALQRTEAQKRALTDRLTAEMASAAEYVTSIMPGDLHGKVEITSRYLPAMDLGGDGFHYRWLDGDHLQVYILDVSGHGIRPALLSASLHNLIRGGTLPLTTLLNPEHVLNKLNDLFQMEEQGGHYFTIWYGVYQASTRTLRYANAGHPPALAINRDAEIVNVTSLSAPSLPIGVFADTAYTSAAYTVPSGGQLLIYSDGAFELNGPDGRNLLSNDDFRELCASLAARPDWSLDALVDELKQLSSHGEFDDDCALVLLTLP